MSRVRRLCNLDEQFESLLYESSASLERIHQERPGFLDLLRSTRQTSLLTEAVVKVDSDLLSKLLGVGCDPNATDGAGITPLYQAMMLPSARVVRVLLENGASMQPGGPDSHALELLCSIHPLEEHRKEHCLVAEELINFCRGTPTEGLPVLSTQALGRLAHNLALLEKMVEAGVIQNTPLQRLEKKIVPHLLYPSRANPLPQRMTCLRHLIHCGINVNGVLGPDCPVSYLGWICCTTQYQIIEVLLEAGALLETHGHRNYYETALAQNHKAGYRCSQPLCLLLWSYLDETHNQNRTKCLARLLAANAPLDWAVSEESCERMKCAFQDFTPHTSPFSQFYHLGHEESVLPVEVVRLMLLAGSRWDNVRPILPTADRETLTEEGFAAPPSLLRAAIVLIRRLLGLGLQEKVQQIGMPVTIQNQILLTALFKEYM